MKKITFLLFFISTFAFSQCPQPDISEWNMTSDGANFDGTNFSTVASYEVEYNLGSSFTPGDGTASTFTFESFPATLTGLESSTLYYFTIRSICTDGTVSDWTDNPANGAGPDPWETTAGGGDNCGPYSLPYINDFNDPDTWTNCQTFYDNDGDGQFWYYANYVNVDEEGNNVAASASYNGATGGALTPDNWVIMGPIDLTDHTDALLEWKVRGIDPSWCQESYSVYIGSSNDYNDLINGSVSYNETIANGGDACGQTFADRSLDISAAAGGLVYIGFRHHDITDMFVLNVDDVSISSSTMSIQDPETLEMNIYPNPVNGNFVTIQTPINGVKYVEVFDITGKRLINTSLNADTLEVSSLSAGMYLIKVTVEGQSKTSKLVVR
jgi:hypothetical protein